MRPIDIFSLPRLAFAHGATGKEWRSTFPSWREGFLHIIYIEEGELNFESQEFSFTARKHDVVVLTRYYDTVVWTDSFHSRRELCVRVKWNYSDSPLSGLYLPHLIPHELDTAQIRETIDSFIYGKDSYDRSNARSVFQFLTLLTLIDEKGKKLSDVSLDIPKSSLYAERAKQYIHRHIHEPLTLRQVAKRLEIAPEYLCNLFKTAQGCTVKQYINRVKLSSISHLVWHDGMKLYEAAAIFGYNDPNYVSRLYKKMFNHKITESIPE
ncbi:MAG: helix-turn-helix domain-containing protein [Clostridia bacterium]|nr:helix-turn-helix domain-containing protein [Clostridia bacterium]